MVCGEDIRGWQWVSAWCAPPGWRDRACAGRMLNAADERDCKLVPEPDLGTLLLDALNVGSADTRITSHVVSEERRYLVEWCGSRVYHGPDLAAALRALAGINARGFRPLGAEEPREGLASRQLRWWLQ